MGDLTEHFSLAEFESRDGAAMPAEARANIPRTAQMLEALRAALTDEYGHECPLVVLSGYRSPEHNQRVGGAPKSLHLKGMAADVHCVPLAPHQMQRVAKALQDAGTVGGLGLYDAFTHVDWGVKRTWDSRQVRRPLEPVARKIGPLPVGEVQVLIKGRRLAVEDVRLVDGRAFVAARPAFEAAGWRITWNPQTRTVEVAPPS